MKKLKEKLNKSVRPFIWPSKCKKSRPESMLRDKLTNNSEGSSKNSKKFNATNKDWLLKLLRENELKENAKNLRDFKFQKLKKLKEFVNSRSKLKINSPCSSNNKKMSDCKNLNARELKLNECNRCRCNNL